MLWFWKAPGQRTLNTGVGIKTEIKNSVLNSVRPKNMLFCCILTTKKSCNFIELKLINGDVQLRFNFGFGSQLLRTVDTKFNDDLWHKVSISKEKTNTTLKIDQLELSNHCNTTNYQYSEFSKDSYVYIGGLPSWYIFQSKNLSLPSVIFEPELKGEIKNVAYTNSFDVYNKQELIAYKGMRLTSLDSCKKNSPCKNNATCIPTDKGPLCDCARSYFSGKFCEKKKKST